MIYYSNIYFQDAEQDWRRNDCVKSGLDNNEFDSQFQFDWLFQLHQPVQTPLNSVSVYSKLRRKKNFVVYDVMKTTWKIQWIADELDQFDCHNTDSSNGADIETA